MSLSATSRPALWPAAVSLSLDTHTSIMQARLALGRAFNRDSKPWQAADGYGSHYLKGEVIDVKFTPKER